MENDRILKNLLIFTAGIMLAFFLSMRVFNDGPPGWKHIVTSDGRGYYAYLPALLIDRDPSFAGVAARESRLLGVPHYKPSYLVKSGDRKVNKYFAGEALLLLPFFQLGALFTWIGGTDFDGYSFFFQFFTGIGTLFYLLAGMFFLARVLGHFRIRPAVTAIVLAAILFGTNLFYYALWQPTMSHIFSFFAVNGFLWFSARLIRERSAGSAALTGLFLGLVCLVRPTNAVAVLLFPMMAGSFDELRAFFTCAWKRKASILLPLMILLPVIFIQPLLWYAQTGRFFIWWYYRDEGFNFMHPEVGNVLFGFTKGLFVYTPLAAAALAGLVPLLLKNRLQFFSVAVFLVSGTWIIASWWNWYYGDGFGLRAFIDYYGVFAILLAFLINPIRIKAGLVAFSFLLLPFVFLNLLQTWQYTHQVIQPNSMNREKYRHVFLRTDSAVINSLGGNREMASYAVDPDQPVCIMFNDFEKEPEGWSAMARAATGMAYSGEFTGLLDSVHPFSSGIVIRAGRLGKLPSDFFVDGEVMVRDLEKGAGNRTLIVLSMDSIHPGENWWQGFRMNDVPQENVTTWRQCRFSLMTPVISNPDGILKIYLWNTGKKTLLLDDFRVKIYGRKNLFSTQ